jgi:hypothetical protein
MRLYPTQIILEYIYNSQELTLMKLYPTHIILEYIEFSNKLTLMKLYSTCISLEYIEFSRANPHEVLISPKRERENTKDTYLFSYFVPFSKGQMH